MLKIRFVGWTTSHLRLGTKEGNIEVVGMCRWENDILSMWDQPNDYLRNNP